MGRAQKRKIDLTSVESRIYKYIEGENINQLELTDCFLDVVKQFMESASAKDYRALIINKSKNDRKYNDSSKHFEREQLNLLIIANNRMPSRKIAHFLYKEWSIDDSSLTDEKTLSRYINIINSRKHELKKILENNYLETTTDDLQTRVLHYINIIGLPSLSATTIQLYKDALTMWFSPLQNWESQYQKYCIKTNARKPNSSKFVNIFCSVYHHKRANAQTYLINCITGKCFSESDYQLILNGFGINNIGFLNVLGKIKALTSK